MDTKMQFLFVVYLCILQCQLFEFRALEGPAIHVHQIPHHGLRVARAAKPQTVVRKAKPTIVPVTSTDIDGPLKTNEPVTKSTPVNSAEKTTSENPTTDIATKAKQEPSLVEEIKPAAVTNANPGKAIETDDDKITTSTEKPTPANVAVVKGAKPETVTPTTKKNNDEVSETQVEELDENIEPQVSSTPIAYTSPAVTSQTPAKTNQDATKETKERPVTSSHVLHKSSKGNESEEASTVDVVNTEDSTPEQTTTSNGPKNVKTKAVKEVVCEDCKATPESMESY